MDKCTVRISENKHNFFNEMYKFLLDQKLVDTKLILLDGEIKVHSPILFLNSKKCYKMLETQTDVEKILDFTQFDRETIGLILKLCYEGSVTICSNKKTEILSAINFFEIDIKNVKEPVLEMPQEENRLPTKINLPQSENKIAIANDVIEILDDVLNDTNINKNTKNPRSLESQDSTTAVSPKSKKANKKLRNPFSVIKKKSEVQVMNLRKENPSTSLKSHIQSTNQLWPGKSSLDRDYCVVCETHEADLKLHLKVSHKKMVRKRSFICEKCGKGFYYSVFHEEHINICAKKKCH